MNIKKFLVGGAAGVLMFGALVIPVFAANADPGCNKPGTTFVGQTTTDDANGAGWKLTMHGNYVLGRCNGTGVVDGSWNVQTLISPEGYIEHYKNVFTTQDLSSTGAYLYTSWEGLNWYIVESNGDSPYLVPTGGVHSTATGFGSL